jgi:hypothetical protein
MICAGSGSDERKCDQRMYVDSTIPNDHLLVWIPYIAAFLHTDAIALASFLVSNPPGTADSYPAQVVCFPSDADEPLHQNAPPLFVL